MVNGSVLRAGVVILVLAVVALPAPIQGETGDSGQGDGENCTYSYVEDLGSACRLDSGLWKVAHSDGTYAYTHGADPVPQAQEEDRITSASARPPECVDDPESDYHHVLIYARAHDDEDRYDTIAPELLQMVHNINGLLHSEATSHGALIADYRFRCTGGELTVFDETLPTSKGQADFDSIVTDLRNKGYDSHRVKHWVFYDDQGACSCAGIGHVYNDDRLSVDNYNNGYSGAVSMFGVTFGYLSSTGERVMMHENGHNMGAVQLSAPNTSPGGYHCNDGQDAMCYDDSGPNDPSHYDPDVCAGDMRYDCNKDDYFHPDPPSGNHLHTHWNIGSQLNRFLTVALNLPPLMQELSCVPDPSGAGETVTCTFHATDQSEWIHYDVDWGDGTSTRVPSSGSVTPGEDQSASHTWQATGVYTVSVTATDDASPALTSDPMTTQQEVLGPVAVAEAGPARGTAGDLFTFDGSGSHHPVSTIVSHEWTRSGTIVSTDPVHEAPIDDPGDHCRVLTVTDEHGISDTDTACVEVNHPPVAVAKVHPPTLMFGDDATFDATDSYDPDGAISTYTWSHEDTVVSTDPAYTRSFDTLGTHCLLLEIVDADDEPDTDEVCVEVVDPEPPVAVAASSTALANRGHPVTFDAAGSHDPNPGDGELSYEWRLDGTLVSPYPAFTRTYSSTGTRCYELTVTNPWGLSDNDTACTQITDEYTVRAAPTQESYLLPQRAQVDVTVRQVTGERVSGAHVQIEVSYTSGDDAVDDLLGLSGCSLNWSGSGSTLSGFVRFTVPNLTSRCIGTNAPGELVGTWHVTVTGSHNGNEGTHQTAYRTGT